jgi:hypothetical protein
MRREKDPLLIVSVLLVVILSALAVILFSSLPEKNRAVGLVYKGF